ncbi:MAG: hypothetical protein IT372_38070 [Polyangiaceae bacterium]|nr:hypothetical protein [Polyangiaceae bacterium]
MAKIAGSEMVVPRTMSPAARQALVDELYAVHCEIFEGVDKASFAKYVVDSKAEHTWIQLYKGERGRIVGYFAVHVYERELRGETVAVFRAQAGMTSAYRGGNVVFAFGIERVLRYVLAHPGRPIYYVGLLVHPSSYAQLARFADDVFPNAQEGVPSDVAALITDLAPSFGLEPVDQANPLVCKSGWKTIDTAADRAYWLNHTRPSVRFFIEANPGFVEGHGLLTVVPLTLGGVLRSAGRFAESRARRWARSVAASWTRLFRRTPALA